jgi:hypothetical protein
LRRCYDQARHKQEHAEDHKGDPPPDDVGIADPISRAFLRRNALDASAKRKFVEGELREDACGLGSAQRIDPAGLALVVLGAVALILGGILWGVGGNQVKHDQDHGVVSVDGRAGRG